MRLPVKLAHLPARMAAGGFILNSGLSKRNADEETAASSKQKKAPLGVAWIEPEDVAPLVVFLASEEARMVSGTSFAATGGDSANLTA